MNRLGCVVVTALLSLTPGCFRTNEQPNLGGQDVRLTVLHTSDLHSRLIPYFATPGFIDRGLGLCFELQPLGGAARLQRLLKRERARSDRVMHLDSGDCFQGAPIFNQFRGEAEIRAMSAFRPDAVVIGNHEFDLGARNIASQYGTFGNGAYPLLAANYIFGDPADPTGNELGALVKPFTIVNMDGLRVAIIGGGNQSSMTSIRQGGNSSGITPLEPVEAIRTWVNALHDQVDLIFIVSHMGLTSRTEPNLAEDTELITGYERTLPPDAIPECQSRFPEDCWTVTGTEAGGQVRVRIPGVRGIDAIFGGHLHIVLNPPKVLVDPAGRQVLLVHSGAFAKFLGRADLLVRVPKEDENARWGAEIISHQYTIHPITNRVNKKDPLAVVDCPPPDADGNSPQTFEIEDSVDNVTIETQCQPLFAARELLRTCLDADRCRQNGDACSDDCRKSRKDCPSVPAPVDAQMLEMLDPFVTQLNQQVNLARPLAYATNIIRRFGQSGEDSELGNLVADSMRLRNRVEAQFAMTNTLGIRTNMEEGLVTIEQMFNIFPFENTLTTMFLSGVEVQELFDFVTERSTERGCQTQAQVSGVTFTMNCAQELRNLNGPACKVAADCEGTKFAREGREKPLQCRASRCYKSPADDILVQGEPINPTESYRVAVNDFIARGGSNFEVLRRNTTKVNTGLSLRDALIDYMRTPPAINGGGPGRVCGSPYLLDPPTPPLPHVTIDKKTSPDASCDDRPPGCESTSGLFVRCDEDGDLLKFYCLPYDFDTCDEVAEHARLFETRQLPAGTENACAKLDKECQGQLHCCAKESMDANGNAVVEANYYCMAPLCIDPPPTERIRRIIQ